MKSKSLRNSLPYVASRYTQRSNTRSISGFLVNTIPSSPTEYKTSKPVLTFKHSVGKKTSPLYMSMRSFFSAPTVAKPDLLIFDEVMNAIQVDASKSEELQLVRRLLLIEYQKYLEHKQTVSQNSPLFHMIDSLPEHLNLQQKLDLLIELMLRYPAMPVITAHPTRAMSNEAVFLLYEIIELLVKLKEYSYNTPLRKSILNEVIQKIQHLINQPLLPEKNLTPEEECHAALYIYKRILKTFPDFYEAVVDKFVQKHGGDRKQIAAMLKKPIMESYYNIGDWNYGDTDGNLNKLASTMKKIISDRQKALLELYIESIDAIMGDSELFGDLAKKREQFEQALENSTGFTALTVEQCEDEKKATLDVLDKILEQIEEKSPLYKKVIGLRHLVDLAGFYGNLKAFVRQTTTMHTSVWNNFTEILQQHYPEIHEMVFKKQTERRIYDEFSRDEQEALHNLVASHRKYFDTLHEHASEFTQNTHDELGRLALIHQNPDVYPTYIFSDTKDHHDFAKAALLMHFATYHLEGKLDMTKIHEYPFNIMPLCETVSDLHRTDIMMDAMFQNYHIRQKMVSTLLLLWLFGPSDNSKVAGIVVYGLLLRTQMLCGSILDKYKQVYPELKDVKFRWKQGFGPDWIRQYGNPRLQRHTTFQGWGAFNDLAAPGSYESLLHGLMGMPCATEFKIEEIKNLQKNNPEAYEAWLIIEQHAMDFFQSFISQDSIHALLAFMTVIEIEKRMNNSSRAGSKKSPKPHEARAIGVVNHYMIAQDYWNVYMSIFGLLNVPEIYHCYFPVLFNDLTVWKDIIYKVFYSLALSNNSHHWIRLKNEIPSREQIIQWSSEYRPHDQNELHQTLAYMDINKSKVLNLLLKFFPVEQQQAAREFLHQAEAKNSPTFEMVLPIMDILQGDLPSLAQDFRESESDFEQFRHYVESYRKDPSPILLDRAVIAGRVIQLAGPPPTIANLISPKQKQAYQKPFSHLASTEEGEEEMINNRFFIS